MKVWTLRRSVEWEGDSTLALFSAQPQFDDVKEYFDGDEYHDLTDDQILELAVDGMVDCIGNQCFYIKETPVREVKP